MVLENLEDLTLDELAKLWYNYKVKEIWPLGQAVKTPPSQGGIMGSIPVGVTKEEEQESSKNRLKKNFILICFLFIFGNFRRVIKFVVIKKKRGKKNGNKVHIYYWWSCFWFRERNYGIVASEDCLKIEGIR